MSKNHKAAFGTQGIPHENKLYMHSTLNVVEFLKVKVERFHPWNGGHAESHLEHCALYQMENQAIAIFKVIVDGKLSPPLAEVAVPALSAGIVHHVELVIRLVHQDGCLIVRREILDEVLGDLLS